MGKRSSFERNPRDFYPTPYEAVIPLLRHLPPKTVFHEPCAGDGALIDHLEANGHRCAGATDITPVRDDIDEASAFELTTCAGNIWITNPPWDRKVLHPLIDHLTQFAPAWLLFDADWMHTKQAVPYMDRCTQIVSVGRVKWIPDSKMTGKDNACWYKFKPYDLGRSFIPLFHGRNP